MRILSIVALIAATSTPALAYSPSEIAFQDQNPALTAFSVAKLFEDDGLSRTPTNRASEQPEEIQKLILSELSPHLNSDNVRDKR